MNQAKRRTADCIVAIPFLAVLILALYTATFAFPMTDDFCTFGRLLNNSDLNPFAETAYLYMQWTGRYSASFLTALAGFFGFTLPIPFQWTYVAWLVIALASVLASAILATGALARTRNPLLATIATAAFFAFMPSKLEGAMWVTGVAVYTLGIVFLLMIVGLIGKPRGPMTTAITALLIAISAGFNEFMSLVIGAFLFSWTILNSQDAQDRKRNIAYLAVFAVAFAVTIVAPGNFARNTTVAVVQFDIAQSLRMAVTSLAGIWNNEIRPNIFVLIALSAAAFAAGWGKEPTAPRRVLPLAVAVAASLPIHLIAFPMLLGDVVPGRVLNQSYGLTVLGGLLLCGWLGSMVSSQPTRLSFVITRGAIAVAGVMCFLSVPSQQYAVAATSFGPTWKAEQSARHELLSNKKHEAGLQELAAFTDEPAWPPVLKGGDITTDPSYWVNHCVSIFYNVEGVALRSE